MVKALEHLNKIPFTVPETLAKPEKELVVPKFVMVFPLAAEPPIVMPSFSEFTGVGPITIIPIFTSVILFAIMVNPLLVPVAAAGTAVG